MTVDLLSGCELLVAGVVFFLCHRAGAQVAKRDPFYGRVVYNPHAQIKSLKSRGPGHRAADDIPAFMGAMAKLLQKSRPAAIGPEMAPASPFTLRRVWCFLVGPEK